MNLLMRNHKFSQVFITKDLTNLLRVKNSKTITNQTRNVVIGIIIKIKTIGSLKEPSEKAFIIGKSEGIGFNHLWKMQLWMSLPSRFAMQRFTGTRTTLSMS